MGNEASPRENAQISKSEDRDTDSRLATKRRQSKAIAVGGLYTGSNVCVQGIGANGHCWLLGRPRLRIRKYVGSKPPSVMVMYHKSKVEIGRAYSREFQGGIDLV